MQRKQLSYCDVILYRLYYHLQWVMFSVLLVCLSPDYSKSNEQICIKLLPEVCSGPRNNLLNSEDHSDYDPNSRFALRLNHMDWW